MKKAVYVFSEDKAEGKIAHVNHVPDSMKVQGLDGRKWAGVVTNIVGGKVKLSTKDSSSMNLMKYLHRRVAKKMEHRASERMLERWLTH